MLTPLQPHDFEGFARWYGYHRLRLTSKAPSPATVQGKCRHLARMGNELACGDEEDLAVTVSDRAQVSLLLERLSATMTMGSLRAPVYVLKDFGGYAASKGWPSPAVLPSDCPPKNPTAPIVVHSPERMEFLVAGARGVELRWWALLAWLTDTGRRIGETLEMQWGDFRLDCAPPYVEFRTTKNGQPQYVPLSKRLVTEVFTPENVATLKAGQKAGRRAYLRDPNLYPFPWGYGTIHRRMAGFLRRMGVDTPVRGGNAFHIFRHSVITDRIARGVPIQAVSRLAGHASVAITAKTYDHTSGLTFARFVERDAVV